MLLRERYRFDTTIRLEQTIVRDGTGARVATLTRGARTVVFEGHERTIAEPATTPAQVTTTAWVRVAPKPWDYQLLDDPEFGLWFEAAVERLDDDVIASAVEYVTGRPQLVDSSGLAYAGDAAYGTGSTDTGAGADFFAYLGIPWTWADGKVTVPDPRFLGQLDCSGYVRLVYGYRHGIPMFRMNTVVAGLPRSSWAIAQEAPVTVAFGTDPARPPADLVGMQPGDLVCFALHDDDPARISHVGIYLGADQFGMKRFVSSRQKANGPTLGDVGGRSVVDSTYFWPRLRRVVRL